MSIKLIKINQQFINNFLCRYKSILRIKSDHLFLCYKNEFKLLILDAFWIIHS